MGINLSEKIYFSADTRLTNNKSKEVIGDDVQKFEIINNSVVVAVAGNLELSKFLITEVKREHFRKRDINYIRKKIEKWIQEKVKEFIRLNKEDGYSACLLFGGLVNGHIESPSRLFAVLIDTNPISAKLEIKDARDGEFLIFGADKLSKDTIDDIDREKLLEISNIEQSFDTYVILMTGITMGIAERRGIKSIGGSVIPLRITARGVEIIPRGVFRVKVNKDGSLDNKNEFLSEVTSINGVLCYKHIDGTYKPLVSFLEYDSYGEQCLHL